MKLVPHLSALAALAAVLSLASAQTAEPFLLIPNGDGVRRVSVASLIAANPLPAGDNIRATHLGRTDSVSFDLIQIRDREKPHFHATHDLTVTVMRGEGTLYLRGVPYRMQSGDAAFVPRGTPHWFANQGPTPAVAFVSFAPPYDGTDQVPIAKETQ